MTTHQVKSEIAYDLMQDHMDAILTLLNGPMQRAEAEERFGSAKTLDRMIRHGLVRDDGGVLRAVSSAYHKLRQEGMVSFLEHYVLPSLNPAIQDDSFATLENMWLSLSSQDMRSLSRGPVTDFFRELEEISEEPEHGVSSRLSLIVVGTSRVEKGSAELDDGDQALVHLKNASSQRAVEGEKEAAVVIMCMSLADNHRYSASLEALRRFSERLREVHGTTLDDSNYHLSLASHWQSTIDIGGQYQQEKQTC